MRRTFDARTSAREFRDREAARSPEQVEALKPGTRIDQKFIEGELLCLERDDQLAAGTVNGYRQTTRYSLRPWIDPDAGNRPASAPLDAPDAADEAAGGVVLAPHRG